MSRKFNPATFHSPESVARRNAETAKYHATLTWMPLSAASPWQFSVLVKHEDGQVLGALPPKPNEGRDWWYSFDKPKTPPVAFAIPERSHGV